MFVTNQKKTPPKKKFLPFDFTISLYIMVAATVGIPLTKQSFIVYDDDNNVYR